MPEFTTVSALDDVALSEATLVHGPDGPWDDEEVIDTVLRLVADHHRTVGAAIGRRSFSPTLAELRQSPLGQDLRFLTLASHHDADETQVREVASRVTDLLLRPLAAEGLVIPDWFWSTAIGQVVARAARASYGPGGLIDLTEAAARLGVSPAIVSGWTMDGAITALPDEQGRMLVPREAIERRRLVALALDDVKLGAPANGEDVLVHEERLAS
ncbi:MAG: hypothetical protein KC442_17080 [Thermomicrobiales bacterium]|nr:hypothetical protein [Thermomicrobiales bacterium]